MVLSIPRIKKYLFWSVFCFSVIYPLYIALRAVISGSIPFWFDPARDLLLAESNLNKLTLIGPPSGIPGVFYGPYWLWLLSLTLNISRNPRFITLLALTVPYFLFFPYLLIFKFKHIYDRMIGIALWWLFILNSSSYTLFLWNPHLAPLLFLFLIYILLAVDFNQPEVIGKLFIAGIICGFILNIHISFGLGIALAGILYIAFESVRSRLHKKSLLQINYQIKYFISFISGIFLTFIPFFLFELRHGFHQVRAVIDTLSNSFLYNSAVVGQTGLKKGEIINQFLVKSEKLLTIPVNIFQLILFVVLIVFAYRIIHRTLYFAEHDKKFIAFITLSVFSLLYLFLSSKNPVWEYHFIGTEIIVLLVVGWIAQKITFIKYILIIWVGTLIMFHLSSQILAPHTDPLSISSLSTKEYIVKFISKDAGKNPYLVYAYSPAIYTYDYDYLFRWLAKKDIEERENYSNLIYLIIPKSPDAVTADFINYRSPGDRYKTLHKWAIADGTLIVKRVL